MKLCKKNRIWKKLGVLGMAVFMTGMMSGGSTQAIVCAAQEAYGYELQGEDEQQGEEELQGEDELRVEDELQSEDEQQSEDELQGEGELQTEDDCVDENEESDNEDTDGENADLSDDLPEDNEDGDNNKKTPDFTLRAVTDENTIRAGSDLIYTVTMENTGEVMLKNIQLHATFSQEELSGEWSGEDLEQLDIGMKKERYLTVKLPEGLDQAVILNLTASAETEAEDGEESTSIIQETSLETGVIPLKASFEVTKSADRSVAVPGDKILFQICIRNTGERTLHSVITTERFQLGNVPVQFLEKEGVILNKSKTKARIDKIEPGRAAGLEAMVTLPENLKEQELLNEVTVTTLETGDQTVASQARIQVKTAKKDNEDSAEGNGNDSVDAAGGAVSHTGESYPASTHPKTGDPYQPFLWLAMIPGALLAAGWIRSRM